MHTSISKMAALVIAANALLIAILPVMANDRANQALSEKIYGQNKATLLWPGETTQRLADDAPEYLHGRSLTNYYGTVSRVRSRDYFDLRTDDGRIFRVVGQDDYARFDVTANQRVRVRGYLTQDILVAASVTRVEYDGNYRVDFPGTVYSINGVSRLTVRGDNGRTYEVDARSRLPYGISAGDYLRITGSWDGISVIASDITILNHDRGSSGSSNRYVDFPGQVTNVDRYRNTISVRGDNGITYTVFYNGSNFAWGDRVRVTGYFDGYSVRANSVSRR